MGEKGRSGSGPGPAREEERERAVRTSPAWNMKNGQKGGRRQLSAEYRQYM